VADADVSVDGLLTALVFCIAGRGFLGAVSGAHGRLRRAVYAAQQLHNVHMARGHGWQLTSDTAKWHTAEGF